MPITTMIIITLYTYVTHYNVNITSYKFVNNNKQPAKKLVNFVCAFMVGPLAMKLCTLTYNDKS